MKRLIAEIAILSLLTVGAASAQEGGVRMTANVVTPPTPVVVAEPPVEVPAEPETPPSEPPAEPPVSPTPSCNQ